MSPRFKHPRSHRAGRGFTLIELLTVITIMAVLASILVPLVGRAQVAARKRKSVLLFQSIANAFEDYRVEYGRYPVFPELNATTTTSTTTGEIDYNFLLSDGNNILRKVLTADQAYFQSVSAPGSTNYNGKEKRFLVLDDSLLSSNLPGSDTNPVIVDGFGNSQIGIVVHSGLTRQIDKNAFAKGVSDPDDSVPLTPSVARSLPQPIAIYSLVQDLNNDALTSIWNTNWSYDDYKN